MRWLLFYFALSPFTMAQTAIDLSGMAAFRSGDDEVWRSKYIDEREGWNFIPVPGAWEDHGYPLLDGFAWYRIRFQIPKEIRNDSLVLVISGIDDADETYFNGFGIGKTGEFPPNLRSELRSLRVYPLLRNLREEHNVLAIRVYDMGDNGGITGNIFRIIRADSIASVLNEIVDAPHRKPSMYFSNGVIVSSFNPNFASVEWTKPHLYNELEHGLKTESILTKLTVTYHLDGREQPLKELPLLTHEYVRQSGVIRSSYQQGFDVYWWHPRSTESRVLVVMVLADQHIDLNNFGVQFELPKQYWRFEQIDDEKGFEKRRYFIFAYNSCCDELAERDLKAFIEPKKTPSPWSLEMEMQYWNTLRSKTLYAPAQFSEEERQVYYQSLSTITVATVNEQGLGRSQIVSAFTPPSQAYAKPRDHLLSCMALAEAGLLEEAQDGLEFIRRAQTGTYTFFNVYGTEKGVGYPYLVTPSWYNGVGKEVTWDRKDEAVLSYDGMALYIEAFDALLYNTKRKAIVEGKLFRDSSFIAPYWNELSSKVADVLSYARDSSGLLMDDAPWGRGLSDKPGLYSSLHAAAALRIAAQYARLLKNELKAFLYEHAAEQTASAIRRLIREAMNQSDATKLSSPAMRVFHPLLVDGITLGIFPTGSEEARFVLDVVERGFSIEDKPGYYNALPDGDWFGRQARPAITLRLARAYIANGNLKRAEELFARITTLAASNNGLLPGIIDPVSKNWYGALPAVGSGAAEYILTAEAIARARLRE